VPWNLHWRTGTAVDRRVEELHNLRVALATFAVHLDAFEARLTRRPAKALAEPVKPASQDLAFAKQIVAAMSGQGARSS
jgi:CHAD domain-containing protein